jgi:hypothetical protein
MSVQKPYASVPGDNSHDNTATTATAGTGAALPATVQGYAIVSVAGQDVKIPYYKV